VDQAASLTPERLLRQLEWRVVRRLDGRLQGDYRSLFRGSGIDFTNLREYEPGDDLRHIEWNVTARMDTPYVREYVEDREVTAWLLLDHSASMGFGPVDRQKDLVLAELATTLALILPARSGRNQALMIADILLHRRNARAEATDAAATTRARRRRSRTPNGPERHVTDLGAMLHRSAAMIRRRALVVVVSDFISEPGWEQALSRLARRHEVVAIQISDPREDELPDVGSIYVEDTETGEQIFVDTSDPGFRSRLRAAADGRQAALEEATRSVGVDLHQVRTDEDLVRSLLRISALRRSKRR
jgi:uncharacterized protein (DUF58 family)